MAKLEQIYRCTEAGLRAWRSRDPALSAVQQQILGLIGEQMHSDVIHSRLRRHADHAQLAELEARGLIACEAAEPKHDLDFTGSFSFSKPA